MLVTFGIILFGMLSMLAADPPDFAGKWSSEEAGQIVLTQKSNGKVTVENLDGVLILRGRKEDVEDIAKTISDQKAAKAGEDAQKGEQDKGTAIDPAAELKALQGPWNVVSVEQDKNSNFTVHMWALKTSTQEKQSSISTVDRFDFRKKWIGYKNIKDDRQGTIKNYVIDPTSTPKTIDLEWSTFKTLGIYELDKDRLKICFVKYSPSLPAEQRPKDFSVTPGSGKVLLTLERYTPHPDEKAIQGLWTVIDQVDDGKKPTFRKDGMFRYLSFNGSGIMDSVFLPDGAERMEELPYFLDPAKKTIRIVPMFKRRFFGMDISADPKAINEYAGIYRLENDRLTIAFRFNGPAPEKLESAPGSGVTLLELQRKVLSPAEPSSKSDKSPAKNEGKDVPDKKQPTTNSPGS